ncbi:LOW QUALITY PROTEIN: alpha-mannosidase At3g26720-like [Phalaenopsis equestris]|uniref:LOW QUALITY PROTEIN: alpha-mannosidase At3g26720-like n=1 Tax=Phalaenopsis equestris TaxID=78828 RepID=UPI0009E488F5|nr:LOW QUALITY PROTEIN: alpha-mannosidase At3g26720-like [Phalaenopsis equestris]
MADRRLFTFMLFVLSAVCCSLTEAGYISYNTNSVIVPGKINVHLVAHSHDDVGWLKTVDQYYVGSKNEIQGACVQNVLDSVVSALLADRNRRFIYVEQAFFQRWWRQQSDATKKIVKELVSSGQLEFINGGMCMHDEAAPHYIDMIDQTTLIRQPFGHLFIKQEFGQIPRIGWQIDPFGHSAVQAYLLSAEVGFDALYFSRIDYQDRETRKKFKTLEIVWRGSKTLGSSSDVFTGIFPKNYEPPPGGFYFEVNDKDPVIQDDPLLFDYNVQERVNDFVVSALSQANITRTNHIMFTMGTDFKYQYANSWFRQMDKFIHYVNQDGRVNALYSTPSLYTDAKYASNETWTLKTDDFFPYADGPNGYWTGYFSSRPSFKQYVRMLSGYNLAAKQLEFLKGRDSSGLTTDSLADALAIAQHHDAVSGTEQQHVANDYAKRLFIGYTEAEKLVGLSLGCLTESSLNSDCYSPKTNFEQCPLLNISYCPPSEADFSNGKDLVVLLYNSLGWKRDDVIRIPVSSDSVTVLDSANGREIESQLLPINEASVRIRSQYVKAYLGEFLDVAPKFWLAFPVSVPPFGFSTYIVSNARSQASAATMSSLHPSKESNDGYIEIGPGELKLLFNANEHELSYYTNSGRAVNSSLKQSYKFYAGSVGEYTDLQASGAYVFRPDGTFPIKSDDKVPFNILHGPILDEVHQQINPWIYQITRVYKTKEHVEFEFLVGPIPIEDETGKELATEFSTSMETNKIFYTDSNGRDFIKRIRDYRTDWALHVNQPVAGNYYPINLGIYIEDDNTELSLLVDRCVGGSSIQDGQVELMLHRRLLHDDGKGVAEALNERVCVKNECTGLTVQGKFYLRIDPLGEGANWRRTTGQEIYSPLLVAFTVQDGGNWANSHVSTFSAMESYSLPGNVAMITLQVLKDGTVLLRLAHLYEVDEDKDLSIMATVDLNKIFPGKKILKITETNLSANQERSVMEKKRLKWRVDGTPAREKIVRGGPVDPSKLLVELGPMEIRTFLIYFDKPASSHAVQ